MLFMCNIGSILPGESTLQQRREIKTANMAVKIKTNPEHPIKRHLKNKKSYSVQTQTKLNYPFVRQSQKNLLHAGSRPQRR
jgi:hypothetical protein